MKWKKEEEKNVYLLGTSSLFNDVASEIVTPVLPFYITALGGGGVALGLLSGLREGLANLLKLFGGWYSDKLGKRMPFVYFGYIFSIIARFLIGFANSWQAVVSFVSLERLGKIRDAPRDAIISQTKNEKGRNFGIHQMLDSLGGVLGTIIVIFLFWKFSTDFKEIVLVAAIISLFSIVPLFFVKEKGFIKIKRGLLSEINHLSSGLKYFIFVSAVFAFANFGLTAFFLVRAKEAFGVIMALSLYALFNLVYSSTSPLFGRDSDKHGRKKLLYLGYFIFSLICLGFGYTSNMEITVFLFLAYGLVYSLTEPVQKALVVDLAENEKGSALGFFYFVRGVVIILGGLIAGIIWNFNQNAMFYYLAGISLIALILLIKVRTKK